MILVKKLRISLNFCFPWEFSGNDVLSVLKCCEKKAINEFSFEAERLINLFCRKAHV